uniref:Forkhead-associated protein n=1 Tax=Rubinisphaera brasiliensis (strain ATCC 49424 / DSM 5305 / JCM 21570 / IAM 15109 / NBRC 103401 / IFAM 1448) TaxID=756272 RepID=F0SN18_RUBBR|nr:Forkhead-associated protein [Rubinisphaera brasiliensis DSM 5305]
MYVELQVDNKRSNVKRLVIRSQALIGRQNHCDVRVLSGEISREHCRIEVVAQGAVLIDLGSTNGTFLNGKRIEAQDDTPLGDNDQIQVGPASFSVRLVDVDEQTDDDAELGAPVEGTLYVSADDDLLLDDSDEAAEEDLEFSEDELLDLVGEESELAGDDEDGLTDDSDPHLAGVASDSDLPSMSEDDAFDKFLKDI